MICCGVLYVLVKRLSCPFDLGSVVRVASVPLADHGVLDLAYRPGIPITTPLCLVADEHHHRDLTPVRSVEPDVGNAQNRWILGVGCMGGRWCPPESERPEP